MFCRDLKQKREKMAAKPLLYKAWLRIKTLFNIARGIYDRKLTRQKDYTKIKENCLSSINKLNVCDHFSTAKRSQLGTKIVDGDLCGGQNRKSIEQILWLKKILSRDWEPCLLETSMKEWTDPKTFCLVFYFRMWILLVHRSGTFQVSFIWIRSMFDDFYSIIKA